MGSFAPGLSEAAAWKVALTYDMAMGFVWAMPRKKRSLSKVMNVMARAVRSVHGLD